MEIRFLGHATFELTHDGVAVLIDPWLTGNPKAAVSADELAPDAILVTHGHFDHVNDVVSIAKRTGATVVAIGELTQEFSADLENVRDPNLGGTVTFDWGSAKLVPAWHTSTTPKGTVNTPAGIIVTIGGITVYHLGDTALFGDLELIGRRHAVDVALMCIGGHYTMDRHDAVEAARLIGAPTVIPCHYNTFPAIETDVQAFKAEVERATGSTVVVLEPGERSRRDRAVVTHAVVLIVAERAALTTLGSELAAVDGVAEAYSVTGEWDFVAIVRVREHEQLARVVMTAIGQLPGVARTQTMVAFEAFSRHDLEALFSLGD